MLRHTFFALLLALPAAAGTIPLPEHPRPDFERAEWINLNGTWGFRFDAGLEGEAEKWFEPGKEFPLAINVPFGWGTERSGVTNGADVAWYRRSVRIPETWKGKRVFLVVGACEWLTRAWFGGRAVGSHQGGYTPFEFELTPYAAFGKDQEIVLRVDDAPRDFRLNGKQRSYGDVRGIWQTVYLEARSETYLETVHFIPDIDHDCVTARVSLSGPAKTPLAFRLVFSPEDRKEDVKAVFAPGEMEKDVRVSLRRPKLWELDNPYLYEVKARLDGENVADTVSTYFGMRKISVAKLPGTDYAYVALNNKPHYLRLTLDQSYTPDGYYTFPSDEFMKNEILISKNLGLSGNRIHIKVEVPRKLYWADKLGLLVMADLPNAWGEPTREMFEEGEHTLREMIRRDMNHPSVFCWVLYNETWGLFTKGANGSKRGSYLLPTQERVAKMYRLAKALDPTRLVEDQSPCHRDHVVGDLNSWHDYKPGYLWEKTVKTADEKTFVGSTWNYIAGHRQTGVPMLNSECGNVWGYTGSAGDVDWSWDYHAMMNAFWRYPKCAGWLYTEHHDVCKEWNGYVRFDRTKKFTGIEELLPGMTLRDLHGDAVLALDTELCREFAPGAEYRVPVTLWLQTDRLTGAGRFRRLVVGETFTLKTVLRYWDADGRLTETEVGTREVAVKPWMYEKLADVAVTLPDVPAVGIIGFILSNGDEAVVRNFTTFVTRGNEPKRNEVVGAERVLRVAPKAFTKAVWSEKQWNVLDGLKVDGAGKGFFEYEIPWPKDLKAADVKGATVAGEFSAKRLNGKDRKGSSVENEPAPLPYGAKEDPSGKENAYPMTDTVCWNGAVRILANGETLGTVNLPDDPADHRGILSWFAQKRDKRLREAGSYGYFVRAAITPAALAKAEREGRLVLRFEADKNGLAIYGGRFGRYPTDLTVRLSR